MQGAELRLLVRPTSDVRNIEGLQADRVTGDLRDPASLERAMAGATRFFMWPLTTDFWVRNPEEMYRSNVEGTRLFWQLLARTESASRVHLECCHDGVQLQRHSGRRGFAGNIGAMIGHYKRSKFMAEQVAMEAGRSGQHVVVVNPSTPVGEMDIKPTPTGRIIVDFLKKKFPAYVDTGLNLVDATDCARGHVAAFEKGRSGERYILGERISP